MHYMNGREAHNGDLIVYITGYQTKIPYVGRLHNAVAGNNTCNGTLLPLNGQGGTMTPNLAECVHFDDFMAAQPTEYPDLTARMVL